VLADAEALLSCYGVGEQMLPDMLHAVVELGFTSSVRFLQPGLLLHGVRAPRSSAAAQQQPFHPGSILVNAWAAGVAAAVRALQALSGQQQQQLAGATSPRSSRGTHQQRQEGREEQQEQQVVGVLARMAAALKGSVSSTDTISSGSSVSSAWLGAPAAGPLTAAASPGGGVSSSSSSSTRGGNNSHQPRTSWRHRKQVESLGRDEGITEWQINSYYAAGRVLVPALLDAFTCQALFKRHRLLQLLTELTGDDGRPGGAMLQLVPVPPHLVGHSYSQLVTHLVTRGVSAGGPLLPLGLLRRKSENRGWRLPYVTPHPRPDVVLDIADGVYVLRQRL
jgi:hypothetical protein